MEVRVLRFKHDQATGVFTLMFIPRQSRTAEKVLSKIMKCEGKDIDLDFKQEKRTNRANAYMWELLGKLATVLGKSTEELYIQFVKEYGVGYVAHYDSEEDAELAARGHSALGKGWTAELMDTYPDGSVDMIMHCGSSIYNRAQMARLIDGVVTECRELGIETRNEQELASLLETVPERQDAGKETRVNAF